MLVLRTGLDRIPHGKESYQRQARVRRTRITALTAVQISSCSPDKCVQYRIFEMPNLCLYPLNHGMVIPYVMPRSMSSYPRV